MKAVCLYKHLPIEDPHSLVDLDIQQPKHPTGHDLLVAIKAISVNPLDKVRRGTIPPPENENIPRILGWDAVGEVIAVGSDCTLFQATPYTMLEVLLDQGQTANFILLTNVLLEENQNHLGLKKLLLCRLQL
jgi:NADPH:quinone reductase-like Zn-dependent oxidoreductase